MVPFRGPPGQRTTTESQLPIKKVFLSSVFAPPQRAAPILPQGYGKYKGEEKAERQGTVQIQENRV